MATTLNKVIRFFSWSVLTLVSVIIIIPVAAFYYFDPNDFKEEVSHFITEKSGLPLEIHGKIEMKYFPWLGVTVHDVLMPQASNFGTGNFIKVDTVDFKMPLRELLHKQLIVETLTFKGLEVNLVKNRDGSTNWELAQNQIKQKTSTKQSNQQKDSAPQIATKKPKQKIDFKLEKFDITDSAVTFTDKSQGQIIQVKSLQLNGEQDDGQRYPLKGQFDIQEKNDKDKPLYQGHITFDGHATLADKITAQFDTTSNLEFAQSPTPWKNMTATMQIDLKANKTINLNDIHLSLGSQVINGKASIPGDEASPITFALNMNMLDLNQFNSNKPATQSAKPATVIKTQATSITTSNTQSNNKGRALSGDISIDTVKLNNIVLNDVKAKVKKTNNIVKLAPLTATLFQGTLNAQVTKDIGNPSAPVLLLGDLNNIQIQPLLDTLKNEKRLLGTANVNFNLAHANDTNGIVKVNVKNGVIEGMDVRYYLSLAQSLVSNNKKPTEDSKRTPFGDLSATLNIHDQTIDNNDLAISASDFTANGEGSIYLGSKTIEYKMQAWKKYSDGKEHPNDFPLAIRIKGPLAHPKVEPDVDLYLKKGLEQEVKKQLGKQVEKNLGKILGSDNAGATQEGQAPSPEQQIQQKIEDKINKGLNKLLKKKKPE